LLGGTGSFFAVFGNTFMTVATLVSVKQVIAPIQISAEKAARSLVDCWYMERLKLADRNFYMIQLVVDTIKDVVNGW
jgi:hypothetical protein